MDRLMLVTIAQLTTAQRQQIEAAARRHGLSPLFLSEAEALPLAPQAEVLFSASTELAAAAAQLKWLCVPSAGVEPYLNLLRPETLLSNSSGAYGVTIAEHVVMVSLELMRREAEYRRIVAERRWQRDLAIRSLCGCHITLLGTGDIGQRIAERMRTFAPAALCGVNRSGRAPGGPFDRVVPLQELDSLLPETQLLVMSLPGTEATCRLMDRRRLSLLPPSAIVVNVGRGCTLDQEALLEFLKAGRLAAAALDVFAQEPLPADDPVWQCPNLLISPHCSGNMTLPYTVERITALFLEDLENYCSGRPLARLVDRNMGY